MISTHLQKCPADLREKCPEKVGRIVWLLSRVWKHSTGSMQPFFSNETSWMNELESKNLKGNNDKGSDSEGRSLQPYGKVRQCAGRSMLVEYAGSQANSLTLLKIGLKKLTEHANASSDQEAVLAELAYCNRAVASLETFHTLMIARCKGLLSEHVTQGIDLAVFLRYEIQMFKVQARRSSCSLVLKDLSCLPNVGIQYRCLLCFFDRFFNNILKLGISASPWTLELMGHRENGFARVHVYIKHPSKKQILSEMLNIINLDKEQRTCRIPLNVELTYDECQESLVFTVSGLN